MQALHPEHLPVACQSWVGRVLGPAAAAPQPLALQDLLAACSPQVPAILVKAPKMAALGALQALATARGASLRAISLGETATLMAEPMLSHAVGNGDWLCLQNCHVAVAWLPRCTQTLRLQHAGLTHGVHEQSSVDCPCDVVVCIVCRSGERSIIEVLLPVFLMATCRVMQLQTALVSRSSASTSC